MSGGGGTQHIFPTGMCHLSGYRFHLLFLEQGTKRVQFSGAGCQNISKGEILLDRVAIKRCPKKIVPPLCLVNSHPLPPL